MSESTSNWRKSGMKRKRNSNLSAFLATLLAALLGSGAWTPCAGAEDNGSNEKLLNAIRDANVQVAKVLLSAPSGAANANAKDEDGLTALMYAAMYAGADC